MPTQQDITVGIAILNFGKPEDTAECLVSLAHVRGVSFGLWLLDNGSKPEDFERLKALLPKNLPLHLLRVEKNLGFAGGANYCAQRILEDSGATSVLFLNNDTIVTEDFLARMVAAVHEDRHEDLVGARMMSYAQREVVDNLGIAMYASCVASSRLTRHTRFFGPSGGCMLMTRRLLQELVTVHGHIFDDRFFAYAEDTDVCFRSLHLGYTPVYVDEAVVYHKGSLTSGGKSNTFVAYQGLRNTLWMLRKNLPFSLALLHAPFIALVHLATIVKYVCKGQLGLVMRTYRDGLAGWSMLREDRRRILGTSRRQTRDLHAFFHPGFYAPGYIRETLASLLVRDIAESPTFAAHMTVQGQKGSHHTGRGKGFGCKLLPSTSQKGVKGK